ncbi:hypothetical protein H5410_029074 [Solanum commersonii]|uniref:Uncharacterized protein n=1 Tax=Solanum commersonii TaxID=4109 RepID=A0A9J5Z9G0_SOLCO|nr:hypothetical protein H5410_029074 [Solanum commersonii]
MKDMKITWMSFFPEGESDAGGARRRPLLRNGVRERGGTGQWRGERGGVMVRGHGDKEVRERVYAISPAKMAMTTAMASPVDFGREQ